MTWFIDEVQLHSIQVTRSTKSNAFIYSDIDGLDNQSDRTARRTVAERRVQVQETQHISKSNSKPIQREESGIECETNSKYKDDDIQSKGECKKNSKSKETEITEQGVPKSVKEDVEREIIDSQKG
jgi:hypothetical protein